ncbi:hypothetical protein [Vibrio maerlii]|uniref:hypothetical protein n=1 Tax=Vibrio maerlii TaxID=2231648 RepID=UPI000E3E353A|nr:hypothetical protein [Vibrio maerlii]
MNYKLWTLLSIVSIPSFASVDWQSMQATLVEEQQLSHMRGKYRASQASEDLYFGVQMLTHWSDGQTNGSAGMNIAISKSAGTLTPTVEIKPNGTLGSTTPTQAHTQGGGMVQLIQIEGYGNQGANYAAITDNITQGEQSVNDGSNVDYYQSIDASQGEVRVGYQVNLSESSVAIQEIRSLTTSKGAYQGIHLSGNDLVVNNYMLMEIALPKSWSKNKSIGLNHSLLKGLK